jgi:hypothetical protein
MVICPYCQQKVLALESKNELKRKEVGKRKREEEQQEAQRTEEDSSKREEERQEKTISAKSPDIWRVPLSTLTVSTTIKHLFHLLLGPFKKMSPKRRAIFLAGLIGVAFLIYHYLAKVWIRNEPSLFRAGFLTYHYHFFVQQALPRILGTALMAGGAVLMFPFQRLSEKASPPLPRIVKCPACGKDVSREAKSCPHCGDRLYEIKGQGFTQLPGGGCLGCLILALISSLMFSMLFIGGALIAIGWGILE